MENNNNLPKSAGGGGEEEGKNIETEQVSNPNGQPQEGGEEQEPNLLQQPPPPPSSRRTPFTNLSQVDSDLALARTLQEQERAYMMLRMNNDGSDYGSWDAGSFLHYDDDFDDFGDPDHLDFDDDDVTDHGDDHDNHELDHSSSSSSAAAADQVDPFDVHAHSVDDDEEDDDDDADDVDEDEDTELDHSVYSSDEAYARALQEAEEREMAARLLALTGINDRQAVQIEDHAGNSQDTWEEVDPDELSYEELLALGDVVGTESRGLSADTLASLPSVKYMTGSNQNGSNDSCVICRLDYEDGETLTVLSCKHSYHSECINNWLKINKVCPVCSTEVSTSGHS